MFVILACTCMFMCMFILLNLNVIYVQNNNFKCYITITFLEVFYSSYQKLKISHIDMFFIYIYFYQKKKKMFMNVLNVTYVNILQG